MATTSPDNLWSPNATDPYQLTTDLATMQSTTQAALNDKGSRPEAANSIGALAAGTYPGQMAWVNNPAPGFPVIWNGTGWNRIINEDTGWVDCTTNSGFSGQGGNPARVRRVGNRVYIKWGWSNTGMTTNGAFNVGVVPAGFRPADGTIYAIAVGHSANLNGRYSISSGTGTISLATGSPLSNYYLFSEGASWFVS